MKNERVRDRLTTSCALLAIGSIGLLATPAHADFTGTGSSSETNTRTILATIYGGTWAGADFAGTAYTSDTGISARRVDDFGSPGGTLNILAGSGNTGLPGTSTGLDQGWDDGIASITGEAKFAGFSQAFGYTDIGGYHELFEVPSGGSGFFGAGNQQFTLDLTGSNWTWDRSDANGNATVGGLHWSSDMSLNNLDGLDHMITYEILDPTGGPRTWLLFWDDQRYGGDRDFNDLVVEVSAVVAVPTPSAFLLGAMGFGLIGWTKRRLS